MAEPRVQYNDKVKLTDGGQGSVKYIGEVKGKEGVFYGVDLVKGTGKNNGSAGDQVYFKTKGGKKTGRFVTISSIKAAKPTEHSIEFTVGDAVNVKSKGNGIVRFVGIPSFSKVAKPMFGVELDDAKGICDGTFKKITYFTCGDKHGVYVEQNKVTAGKSKQSGAPKASTKKDADDSKEEPKKKKKKTGDAKKKAPAKKKSKKEEEEEEQAEEAAPESPVDEEPEEEPEADQPPPGLPGDEEPAPEPRTPEPELEDLDEPEEEEPAEQEQEQEQEQEAEPEDEPAAEEEAPAEDAEAAGGDAEENNQDEQNENKEEEENLDKIGDITEDVVVGYLKEHYKASASNIMSPHDIAQKMMESQGVPETQFQFHLNQVGRITYWIVKAIPDAFGDCEVAGEGFKIASA